MNTTANLALSVDHAGDVNRGTRVILALAVVALMSAADLWMTLLHMRSGGMMEANAIVRFVAATGSPALLAWWKVASVMPCLLLLFARRDRVGTEVAAWGACLLMSLVVWHWVGYSQAVMDFGSTMLDAQAQNDATWVAMR